MNEQGKTLTQCGVLRDGAKKHIREQDVVKRSKMYFTVMWSQNQQQQRQKRE
jgi:hypothetical protein